MVLLWRRPHLGFPKRMPGFSQALTPGHLLQCSSQCSITTCVYEVFAEAQRLKTSIPLTTSPRRVRRSLHADSPSPIVRPERESSSEASLSLSLSSSEVRSRPVACAPQLTCTATTYQVSVRQGRVCAARRASERKGSHAKSFSPAQPAARAACGISASLVLAAVAAGSTLCRRTRSELSTELPTARRRRR